MALRELLQCAPRDFYASLVILFLESLVYFSFSYMLMLYLIDELGLSDELAGAIYAAFGAIISVYTLLFGNLVDRYLVRKTMIAQLWAGMLAKIVLVLFNNVWVTAFVMFVPLSFTIAVGVPLLSISMRRYTNARTQTLAFGIQYVVMNVGSAVSQVSVDAIRLYIVPLSGSAQLFYLPAYALVMAMLAAAHMVNIVVATLFVRDVHVVEDEDTQRWALQPTEQKIVFDQAAVSAWWTDIKRTMRNPLFWRFVLVSFATTGVKAVYRYLDSLYPIYMKRAPFPVADPEAMPYLTYLTLNPVLVIALTFPFTYVVNRAGWHPFWVILAGTCVSAAAPFFMMIIEYWAVVAFIVTLTLGEIIWSPLLSKYALHFCEPGEEGMFFALSTLPLFAAKIVSGSLSGVLLGRYCPGKGECAQPALIWLIVGAITASSPVLLGLSTYWTKIDVSK